MSQETLAGLQDQDFQEWRPICRQALPGWLWTRQEALPGPVHGPGMPHVADLKVERGGI